MSKMVEASCQAQQVTADGVVVDTAEILSKGQGSSEGILLLEGEKAKYLTSNATDLETTIEKLNSSLNKIISIITAIGAGMTGPTTAPPPTLAVDLAEITAIVVELETLKGNLK